MLLTVLVLTIPENRFTGFEALLDFHGGSVSLLKLLKILPFAVIRVSNSWDEFCLQKNIWQCLETFFWSHNRPRCHCHIAGKGHWFCWTSQMHRPAPLPEKMPGLRSTHYPNARSLLKRRGNVNTNMRAFSPLFISSPLSQDALHSGGCNAERSLQGN